MKMLMLSMGGIGDFIETVPSIRALRESGKYDFLGLVVSERVWPYASRCPYVDRVYSCPVPQADAPGWILACAQIAGLLLRLRMKRYDLMLNFMDVGSAEGSKRMEMLTRFIRPAISAGRNRSGFGKFFDRQVAEIEGDGKSDGDYFYSVASLAGRELPELKAPDLWISNAERKEAESVLERFKGKGPLILIHPGSDRETRRWFPKRFAELASELCRKYGGRVLIIGSSGDWPVAFEIEQLAHPYPVHALVGLRTVGALAGIVEKADLLVCNNSMAMHLAAAAQIPCVAICASGDIGRDRPIWSRDKVQLLWKPLECSPCYFRRCPRSEYMECMDRTSTAEVLAACEKALESQVTV